MPLITWDESFSLGIELIDEQHKVWISLMNELYDAMSQGEGWNVIKKVLTGMHEYTEFHFSTEEKYFEKFDYPEKDQHENIHKKFIDKLHEFEDQFSKDDTTLTSEVMEFMKEWLINHIQVVDRRYVDFFHEHGVE